MSAEDPAAHMVTMKQIPANDLDFTTVLDMTMTGMHGDQWTGMSKRDKEFHLRPLISLTFNLTNAVLEQVNAKLAAAEPEEERADDVPAFVVPDTLEGLLG